MTELHPFAMAVLQCPKFTSPFDGDVCHIQACQLLSRFAVLHFGWIGGNIAPQEDPILENKDDLVSFPLALCIHID